LCAYLKTICFLNCRGDGDYGKLGHGNAATQKSPKQILGPLVGKVVVQISAGYRHSAAVTSDGQLFTWGEGDFGRLGHGDSQFRFVPTLVKDILVGSVSCGAAHTLALSPDCKVAWYVIFQSTSKDHSYIASAKWVGGFGEGHFC
jgi:E3 ubiquitin-protein ligase HERC1